VRRSAPIIVGGVAGASAIALLAVSSVMAPAIAGGVTLATVLAWLSGLGGNALAGWLNEWAAANLARAAQAFRQAAQSLARSNGALGAYFRAMRARKGPQQAVVATAHKLARIVYYMLLRGEPFHEESAAAYNERRQQRELKQLAGRVKKLGYSLIEAAPLPSEVAT
jgi:transposase